MAFGSFLVDCDLACGKRAWYDDGMYRRSSIPNEASLTALEIMTLTMEQYHTKKRKGNPSAAAYSGPNGHGKIKTVKPPARKPSRSAKKS